MIPSKPEDQQTIWAIIKERLQLQDDALKGLVVSYIREIGYRIMHYCNLEEIPEELSFTWAAMSLDAARVDLPNVDEISDGAGGGDSIKIGDTSISPASSSAGVSNMTKSSLDQVVLNYRMDLNRYRKLRW
ncbi:DNA-packaging protein [Paenibacillus sp. FSL W7-1279]|uniref:DNA-packaging protein n=1 Tax=Paenibacillus sp. FSL W7-1279 TaxID=2921697 RepID=UPI0030DD45D1